MEELALGSRETVHLTVYDWGEVEILLQTGSPEKVCIHASPGMRLPAHCSSLGKVLLAGIVFSELAQWSSAVTIIDTYGPERCVWGSNFPNALWTPGFSYAEHLRLFTDELPLGSAARARVLGETARRLWFPHL
ncbi:MAG: amidohydrolase family protein [Candidatus Handelsmanbacteria bacterium]|nr:amidohydrolase family protein [Candidatus Handelsmanbacteria bacterium]